MIILPLVHFNKKQKSIENPVDLINLPILPSYQTNPVSISTILKNGSTIWGWYKVNNFKLKMGRQSVSDLENLSYRFDGLTALKKSGNYLIYYNIEIGNSFGIYVKPVTIYYFRNSSIAEVFSDKLEYAYKLFLDDNSDFFKNCGQFTLTIKDVDLESYLSWHRYCTITNDELASWQQRSKNVINPAALT